MTRYIKGKKKLEALDRYRMASTVSWPNDKA